MKTERLALERALYGERLEHDGDLMLEQVLSDAALRIGELEAANRGLAFENGAINTEIAIKGKRIEELEAERDALLDAIGVAKELANHTTQTYVRHQREPFPHDEAMVLRYWANKTHNAIRKALGAGDGS